MSESMSSPWIRDYLVDVAESYGAQLCNVPPSKSKKKAQLTDFLTYQQDSYVWAWLSDKQYRVSVRISKDAVDKFKHTAHGRTIIDSRFSLVSVSCYRPMFSPRPLGQNTTGNTPVSHISLEVDHVSSVGIGAHLFGNPREIESDECMNEWVKGLRQDGGGGNVLKLRKQEQAQKTRVPQPPSCPSVVPAPQIQSKRADEGPVNKPERPQDFKRAYAKRWRTIELEPWKLAAKPAVEPTPEDTLDNRSPQVAINPDCAATGVSHPPVITSPEPPSNTHGGPLPCPTSPYRTPSPTPLQQKGTPTDWSLSNRGSPVPSAEANISALGNGIQEDESDALPITSHIPSDAESVDVSEIQPPTPAQRVKRSPIRRSSPPRRSSPEPIGSPRLSSQLPLSSPPPPSSSLPFLSSSLPLPTGFRKNIQRKVPHPGLPAPQPDPTTQGPVQILVPNSDTSGAGSSQSYSQSQYPSQPQQHHPMALPSSLAREFKPLDASTPREAAPVDGRVLAAVPTHGKIDEEVTTSAGDERSDQIAHAKSESGTSRLPVPSAPKIEVLEEGDSEKVEEAKEAQSACTIADRLAGRLSVETHEPTRSQGSMHSLFSDPLEDERTASSHVPSFPVSEEKASPVRASAHDPQAWKEPSFISKNKGKARAVEQLDATRVDRKRRQVQPEMLVAKRVKIAPQVTSSGTSDHAQPRTSEAADITTLIPLPQPRLANFAVDFARIDLGKNMPIPTLNLDKDIKSILLATGRIRTLGDSVLKDGSVYIMR